jgi:hypothetical protein
MYIKNLSYAMDIHCFMYHIHIECKFCVRMWFVENFTSMHQNKGLSFAIFFPLICVHHYGCLMNGRMEFQLHSLSLGKDNKRVKAHNVSKKMYIYFSTFCIILGEIFIYFHVMFCETHIMIF